MINNVAKGSSRSDDTSQAPSENANNIMNNTTTTSPVRVYNRILVVPNAPKIERRRRIPTSQFSAARRNIFYFHIHEE